MLRDSGIDGKEYDGLVFWLASIVDSSVLLSDFLELIDPELTDDKLDLELLISSFVPVAKPVKSESEIRRGMAGLLTSR